MKNKIFDKTFQNLRILLSKNKAIIIIIAMALVAGILCGALLSAGEISYIKILSSYDENFVSYVAGTADLGIIFWNRFLIGLIGIILIFLLNLNYYSSFLSLIYLMYQMALFVLSIIAVFSYYGVATIVLIIIFIIPINIVLFVVLALLYILCFDRAKNAHKHKLDFCYSFGEYYFQNIGVILLTYLLLQIVANFIFPMLFRGIFVINY